MRSGIERGIYIGLFAVALLFSGAQVHAFALADTTGKAQSLADAKGQWLIVNFWATWCAPCLKEIPEIAEFAAAEVGRARVLGVVVDWTDGGSETREADRRKVLAFANKVGHRYPLVLADANSEKAFGTMAGLPTTLIYSPEGKLVYNKTATVTAKILRAVMAGEKR